MPDRNTRPPHEVAIAFLGIATIAIILLAVVFLLPLVIDGGSRNVGNESKLAGSPDAVATPQEEHVNKPTEVDLLLAEHRAKKEAFEKLSKEYVKNPVAFEADRFMRSKWQDLRRDLGKPTDYKPF